MGAEGEAMAVEEEAMARTGNARDERDGIIVAAARQRTKIAMLLAYCGAGFQGMQKNPGAITIEGELEQALIRSGAMPANYGDCPRRVSWARAARTDKGVSSVGQIVSALLFVDPRAGFIDRVNSFLPGKIRLLGYKLVSPSFSAKKFCDRRRYEYIIPLFALSRGGEIVVGGGGCEGKVEMPMMCSKRGFRSLAMASSASIHGSFRECEGNADMAMMASSTSSHGSFGDCKGNAEMAMASLPLVHASFGSCERNADMAMASSTSIHGSFGDCERKRLNHILSRFIGTHNFHNFTSRMRPDDPAAMRTVISFEAGAPIRVRDADLVVPCIVVGESFMLHQIRKMIGLAIAVFRGAAPESIIDMALRRDLNVTIPTAPELGLLLDECMYSTYNEKWCGIHEEVSQKGYEEEVRAFKHEVLYEYIVGTERKEGQMALFLRSLNDRNYADFALARQAHKQQQIDQ